VTGPSRTSGRGAQASQPLSTAEVPRLADVAQFAGLGPFRQDFATRLLPDFARFPRAATESGERLLTVRQVAERLQVSTKTVYQLCERGDLAHVRVSNAIRVAPANLDAFIAIARGRWKPANERKARESD
jgi:excisionase family DNA binding protein